MKILKEYVIGGVTISTKLNDVEVNNGYKSFDVTNLFESGLIHLMNDYNLTWEAVYNIVKESVEDGY